MLYKVRLISTLYRDGAKVLLVQTDEITCPFNILLRYVQTAKLDLGAKESLFCKIHYVKSTKSYRVRSGGLSYTRPREIVLEAFVFLGYEKETFGLHSLRSGGATAAANAGVNDRLLKRHGRWKTDSAKNGYVKDKLDSLLSVSRSLHKK